jgi:hypothetical protein
VHSKMSSQCKRPLEHSVSSQPIKHLCHSAVEEQASTGDASTTIYKIQRPVDMNSTWPVACNVIHLDSTDLQSARRSGSGMPGTPSHSCLVYFSQIVQIFHLSILSMWFCSGSHWMPTHR